MGTIKDRNGMDLTEVEDIKKTWQKKDYPEVNSVHFEERNKYPFLSMIPMLVLLQR